jgi:ComF family protein
VLGVWGGPPELDRSVSDVPSLEHLPAVAPGRAPAGWRGWATALLDLVFPPFCPVCQSPLGTDRRDPLCGGCWDRIERILPPRCRVCGLEIGLLSRAGEPAAEDAPTGRRCGLCRNRPPAFTYARSAARYGDVVREALRAFKFGGRRALAAPLADLLVELGRESLPVPEPDLLLPVPLHPRRERERGFNQALLLARRLGRGWDLPVRADVLARTTATSPQTDLTAEGRRANVRGAFALRRPEVVAGRHVVLVDDVLTTGSTVSACAACLKEGGAATVGVVTVARAT